MDAEAAAWLRLQMEWGVDAVLDETPHDRFADSAQARVRRDAGDSARPADTREGARKEPPSNILATASAVQAPHTAADPRGGVPAVDFSTIVSPAELADAIERFDGCGLHATATRTVLPRGPVGAALMIIGDAPDADEDRSGVPFAGPGGALLDRMLASIGRARDEFVLTSAIPWRPPGGRPPATNEIAACRPLLWRAIALYAPQRVLLCGALATRMILGDDANPVRLRGRWHMCGEGESGVTERLALPMRHPLQLRAGSSARREIWGDLLSISVILDEFGRNSGDPDK